MITQELLHELLHYDPDTGVLRWKVKKQRKPSAGSVAGNPTSHGYLRIVINNREYSAHRIAWALAYGEWPSGHIDHINGSRKDNRLVNLRVVTPADNNMNKRLHANNTSGVIGVYLDKGTGKWRAFINDKGKRIHLGMFSTLDSAKAARLSAQVMVGYHDNHGSSREKYPR